MFCSPEAMEESKNFITSVVLGKDVIPRLGLAQLEYLRSDLLSLLETSTTPKVRVDEKRYYQIQLFVLSRKSHWMAINESAEKLMEIEDRK